LRQFFSQAIAFLEGDRLLAGFDSFHPALNLAPVDIAERNGITQLCLINATNNTELAHVTGITSHTENSHRMLSRN